MKECSSGDDFQRRGASCFERMLFWGLLFSEEIILFQKNPLPGMLFHRRMHSVSEGSSFRDAFPQQKSSCFRRILFQGCFSTEECILIQKNPLPGMPFHSRKHPDSGKYPLRDASMIKMLSHKAPKASHSHKGRKHMKYIHIHPLDNVAVALEDLKKGDLVSVTATPLPDCSQQKPLPEFRKQLRWKEHPNPPRQQCPLRAARLPRDRDLQGWRDTLIRLSENCFPDFSWHQS